MFCKTVQQEETENQKPTNESLSLGFNRKQQQDTNQNMQQTSSKAGKTPFSF